MYLRKKKDEISLIFNFEGNEVNLKSKRNKFMKDIIEQYLIETQKDNKNVIFLYKGNLVKEELKIEDINKEGNEMKILVYEIEDNSICEEKLKDSKYANMPKM